jgi:hypothetical protein
MAELPLFFTDPGQEGEDPKPLLLIRVGGADWRFCSLEEFEDIVQNMTAPDTPLATVPRDQKRKREESVTDLEPVGERGQSGLDALEQELEEERELQEREARLEARKKELEIRKREAKLEHQRKMEELERREREAKIEHQRKMEELERRRQELEIRRQNLARGT